MSTLLLSSFLGALLARFLTARLGRAAGPIVAALPLGLLVYFLSAFAAVSSGEALTERIEWVPGLGLALSFYLDGLSLTFALLISGIGALIVVYSGAYFDGKKRAELGRFYAYLLAFMAAMLGLVLSGNLLTLFVFWELTSLVSFLLIGFDHAEAKARKAAVQALLVTGGGGLALLAGLVLLGELAGSYEFTELLARPEVLREHPLYLTVLLLVLAGAWTKSAQFPFHFWLPNAMAAPTPASAYLHSSTMVKAGIYLLARLHPLLGGTEAWLILLTAVGAATMLGAVVLALRETAFKRLLAYTTVSSLGVLTLLLGLGTALAIKAALVFLVAHAFYKAALFMAAGAVTWASGQRDIEEVSGLARSMPVLAAASGAAALSMAGVLPLIGFLSKELLFEACLENPRPFLLTAAALLASGGVVAIGLMLGWRPFWGEPASPVSKAPPWGLWLGPVLLAALGLVTGLAPQTSLGDLITAAASAVAGARSEVKLALWHGLTLSLALDGAALALGALIYLKRRRIRALLEGLAFVLDRGPTRGYEALLEGLKAVAGFQTRLLQSGYLNVYVTVVILAAVLGTGLALGRSGLPIGLDLADAQGYEVVLGGLIVAAALVAIRSRSRLGAIAAMGGVGYGVGLIFVLFGAPDLAITQLVVETLSVLLFVLAFYHLEGFEDRSSRWRRVRDAAVALSLGALMTVLVLIATSVQWRPSISSFFVENSKAAHGRNVVNVILVDFRGIDTLGEITVLAVAGMGVYALLKLRLKRESP